MRRASPRLLAAFLVLVPMAAHAQAVNGLDQLLTQFQTATNGWGGRIQALTLGTFGILAIIDLAYFVGYKNLMSRGDISDWMYSLIHETVFLGFFFWLLTTYSVSGPLIIRGFQYAAQQTGGIQMQPNGIFAEGMQIATTVIGQISILHPGDSIGLVVCGLLILGCFVWIAASMVVVIIESYFIVAAGQIMLMFGGSHFTYEMAIGVLRTCVGIGLKIYALQLIASVGAAFIATWAAQTNVTFENIFLEIGQSLFLAAIVSGVPGMFERLAGGVGSTGAGSLVAAGGALAAAGTIMGRSIVKAITSPAGLAAAIGQAAKLAGTQQAARIAGGGGPTSAAGRAAALVAATGKNLAAAKMQDVGRGLSGQRSNLGQPTWRMAASMSEQSRMLDEKQAAPRPPSNP